MTILSPSAARAQTPPSAEAYYAAAVRNMQHLRQPANATYKATVDTKGSDFILVRSPDGRASAGFVIGMKGAKPHDSFPVMLRGADQASALRTDDGEIAVTHASLFNATWAGVYNWMHYGLDGPPPEAAAKATPAPSQSSSPEPPVIAVVSSMGVAYYDVVDRGAGTCENGDPGHMVHLIAHEDATNHPLTDATINVTTQTLCMVRFGYKSNPILGINLSVELHFGQQGGYDVVRDGSFDMTIRTMGIAVKRISGTVAYSDFAYPATLDPSLFTTPAASPRPAASSAPYGR